MQKVKSKIVGFSLIELLCAIAILGVLTAMAIVGSYRLINKARSSRLDQQEKTLIIATREYIQRNREASPKVIGESRNITLKSLKDRGYIKDDIYDSYNNSCMENSYIRVYKLSKNEFTYLAYFYCGDKKVPDVEEIPTPTVKVYYVDSNNKKYEYGDIDNLGSLKFNIELSGGFTFNNNPLELDKYSYSIYVKEKDEYEEVFNSLEINANRNEHITISKSLEEYIKDNKITSVKIKVNATNTIGGVIELNSYIQKNN